VPHASGQGAPRLTRAAMSSASKDLPRPGSPTRKGLRESFPRAQCEKDSGSLFRASSVFVYTPSGSMPRSPSTKGLRHTLLPNAAGAERTPGVFSAGVRKRLRESFPCPLPGLPSVALGYGWLARVRGLQDREMWAKMSPEGEGGYALSHSASLGASFGQWPRPGRGRRVAVIRCVVWICGIRLACSGWPTCQPLGEPLRRHTLWARRLPLPRPRPQYITLPGIVKWNRGLLSLAVKPAWGTGCTWETCAQAAVAGEGGRDATADC